MDVNTNFHQNNLNDQLLSSSFNSSSFKSFNRINLVPPRIRIKFFQVSAYSCFYDVHFPNLQGVIKCFYLDLLDVNRFTQKSHPQLQVYGLNYKKNLFKSILPSCESLTKSIISMWTLKMIPRSPRIFIGRLFTSCALLLRFSFFRAISDIIAVFSSGVTD